MDFHDFPKFIGKSGVYLVHPPSSVQAYSGVARSGVRVRCGYQLVKQAEVLWRVSRRVPLDW